MVIVAVTVDKLMLLTWKSDAPCTEEGQQEHEGKASQCVSAGESTRSHLPDDLKQKQKVWLNLLNFQSNPNVF